MFEAVLATNDLQIYLTVKENNSENVWHYYYQVPEFEQAYKFANSANNQKEEKQDIEAPLFVRILLYVIDHVDRYLGYREPVPNNVGTFHGCIPDKSGEKFYQFEYTVKEVLNNED